MLNEKNKTKNNLLVLAVATVPPTYHVVELAYPHKQWWGLVQMFPGIKQAELDITKPVKS